MVWRWNVLDGLLGLNTWVQLVVVRGEVMGHLPTSLEKVGAEGVDSEFLQPIPTLCSFSASWVWTQSDQPAPTAATTPSLSVWFSSPWWLLPSRTASLNESLTPHVAFVRIFHATTRRKAKAVSNMAVLSLCSVNEVKWAACFRLIRPCWLETVSVSYI